mgnify:CR=1 FL=1
MVRKAFVTGGSGYIGTHLIRSLLDKGFEVVAFDVRFNDNFILEFSKKVDIIAGDLLNPNLSATIQEKAPTHVFHLAGVKNRSNVQSEFLLSSEINFKGSLNLFNGLMSYEGIERVILMGTTEEYGAAKAPFTEETREMPNSSYGLSKLSATRLAQLYHSQFGLPITIVRPSIAFGPDQGLEMFLPALINTLKRGEVFKMTQGEQLRDFIYIDDLVDALCMIVECRDAIGEIINIAYGGSNRLRDVALFTAKKIHAEEKLILGAIPYRKFEIMIYLVSIDKARKILGWEPKYSIYEAIEKVLGE